MKWAGGALALLLAALAVSALAAPRPIDVQHSKVTLYVDKQGVFSFLADNHEIDAPISSGSYDAEAKSVELTFESNRVKVLDPKISAGRRDQIQTAMETKVLEIDRYPAISFRSTKFAEADITHWIVSGDLTLHGKTHPIEVRIAQTDPSHFTGNATIRQTDFGITPIRLAGGSVAVKDDVRVSFSIALAP